MQHLLVLRDRITPFEVVFDSTEIEIDLSHVVSSFQNLLRGQTTLLSFVHSSAPRRVSSHRDTHSLVALELKQACESFINHVTTLLVGPLMSFLNAVGVDLAILVEFRVANVSFVGTKAQFCSK